jgi:putative protein-disulfide isomerase
MREKYTNNKPTKFITSIWLITLCFCFLSCAQGFKSSREKSTDKHENPLLCNITEGICETPLGESGIKGNKEFMSNEKITILYFTDPICSACWGIEPQLRKMKLEYGNQLEIKYYMGGLLPSWDGFNGGGINKPSDVAHHWEEVSQYYKMPISGNVWLKDPLESSYPPSIAFKAAAIQSNDKSQLFLRIIREMVFLEEKNIAKWENIADAAQRSGLDTSKLRIDYSSIASKNFENDLYFAKEMGVRGFPTLIIKNSAGQSEKIVGFKPYQAFEEALVKLDPKIIKNAYNKEGLDLFKYFKTLTTNEFAVLKGISYNDAKEILNNFKKEDKLKVLSIKNGDIYSIK